MIIIVTFISFFLEYLLNSFLYDSIFIPLFVLVGIITLETYFDRKKINYFIYAFIIGVCYDYFYTNTLFLNGVIFLLIAFLVRFIHININKGLIRMLIDLCFCIILYRLSFFFLYLIIGVTSFDIFALFRSIYKSLISNIIYGYFWFFIVERVGNKSI